jgi:hypothetical protein
MRKVLPVLLVLLFGMQALAAEIYIPGSALRPLFLQNVEKGAFAEKIFTTSGNLGNGGAPLLTQYRFKGVEMPYQAGNVRGFEAQYKYTGWTRVKEVWVQLYRVPGYSGSGLCVNAANYVVQHQYPMAFAADGGFNYVPADADRYTTPIQTTKIPMISAVYDNLTASDTYVQTLKLQAHARLGTLADNHATTGNPFGQNNLFCLNNPAFDPAKDMTTGACRVDTELTQSERDALIQDLKGADAIFKFAALGIFCSHDYQGPVFATGVRLTVE